MQEAEKEYEASPPVKYHNKKYYNPEYHYYVEEDSVARLYSGRDNTDSVDFNDVLDSVYYNVFLS